MTLAILLLILAGMMTFATVFQMATERDAAKRALTVVFSSAVYVVVMVLFGTGADAMTTTTKPDFSKQEIDHYKNMVAIIFDGDPKKKRQLDDLARLTVAQGKQNMPTADKETLVTFFASIAFLMAHLMTTQVKNIAEVVETTFDGYTVAAAYTMGAYDVDSDEMPVRQEPAKSPFAAPAAGDDRNTGQYL